MDVVGSSTAEVPILVFVGTDVGFNRRAFDEVPDRPCRDLFFLAAREQIGALFPSIVEIAIQGALRTQRSVDVEFEMMRSWPIGAAVVTRFLDLFREIEFPLVAQVHVDRQLREFLIAESGIREQCDDCLVALSEILGSGVDRYIAHRVDLVGCEPDVGLFVWLSFRIRIGGHRFIYCYSQEPAPGTLSFRLH